VSYARCTVVMLLSYAVAAQNTTLSHGGRKLLNKPRRGTAEVTFIDGTTQTGSVLRVTDQFIAFEMNRKPPTCEDVQLSKISAVQWLEHPAGGSEILGTIFLGALIIPVLAAYAIADSMKRTPPPLDPPRGSWELRGKRDGVDAFCSAITKKSRKERRFLSVALGQLNTIG